MFPFDRFFAGRSAVKTVLAFTAAAAACLAQADISGTVTDGSGNPLRNARVTLLDRGLSDTTGPDGRFLIREGSTALGGSGAGARGNRAVAEGGLLRLSLRAAGERVSITLHDLAGKTLGKVLDADLAVGEYQVDPFAGVASNTRPAGMALVRVRLGGFTRIFRLAPGGLSAAAGGGDGFRPESALRKLATGPDTLVVFALGHVRGEKVLAAPEGVHDFRLEAVKWTNIPYRKPGEPSCSRCILDVRKPASGSNWPVIIHFHGGGMSGGDRNEPFFASEDNYGMKYLENGLLVVTPGYNLINFNTTVWPQYIRDAAQAAIWVYKNIASYGGDPDNIFISGFSAGAYLTHMLSIDTTWFQEARFDGSRFAGFISYSGQTRFHDNIRRDLKLTDIMAQKPEAMPMGHIRKTTHPWQIFVGREEGGTVSSNQALYDALKAKGSEKLHFDIIQNGEGIYHTCKDIAAASSEKRTKVLAFIERYRRR